MGRAKHCSSEKRAIILDLLNKRKSYKFIQETLSCSAKMIANAKKWRKVKENRGGKKRTTPREDREIINCAKKSPFISSTAIKKELDLSISTSTIRRRLIQQKLYARRPRKVPLLNKRQIQRRLSFAHEHVQWGEKKWRNILWSDESKIVLFNSGAYQQHVRRPPSSAFQPQYTKKTVKFGGSSIMLWGCFSWYGVGPLHKIEGIMNADVYVNILETVLLPYAEEEMPLRWVYMQDNDPKHVSRKAKTWFRANNVRVLDWPAQSPDLNPIENLWMELKKAVSDAKPQNNDELWRICQAEWKSISEEKCRELVNSLPRRCRQLINNKGHATKY